MDVTTFQCPHCQAVLRMRGKQLTESTFQCPDCNQLLRFSQTAEGATSVSLMTTTAEDETVHPRSFEPALWLNSLRRGGRSLASSPVLISWIVAGTGAFLILLMIIRDQNSSDKTTAANQPATSTEIPADLPEETEPPEPAVNQSLPPTPPALPEPEKVVRELPVEPPLLKEAPVLIAEKPEQIVALEAQKPELPAPLLTPETDVMTALQIPIIEFRQPESVPLKKLMRQMEEILDTKFQVAENITNDAKLMNTPISFSLKNTTISLLLKQILSKAALTFSVKSNKIYIQRIETL